MGRSNMAVGKNKGLKIGGKKGAKKKIVDPFTRKDWYDIKAPSVFKVRQVGKTLVNRTAGTRIASDGLKGRVYEVSLADLQNENDAERSFRKFRLICEDVQGKNCLTNFHGMGLTTDKLRSMVKKWQTLMRETLMSRPLTDTRSAFSALASLASRTCPPRRPAMLRASRLGTSGRRWLISSRGKSAPQTSRMLSTNLSPTPSQEISRRHAKVSTLFMTCTFAKLR